MTVHTIEVSEEVYQRLHDRAMQLRLTPEQLVEDLVIDSTTKSYEFDDELDYPVPPPGSPEALAAFERLTNLFADVTILDLESVLNDPMIELANVDIDEMDEMFK